MEYLLNFQCKLISTEEFNFNISELLLQSDMSGIISLSSNFLKIIIFIKIMTNIGLILIHFMIKRNVRLIAWSTKIKRNVRSPNVPYRSIENPRVEVAWAICNNLLELRKIKIELSEHRKEFDLYLIRLWSVVEFGHMFCKIRFLYQFINQEFLPVVDQNLKFTVYFSKNKYWLRHIFVN